jgi:hypothetical protein
MPTVAFGPAGLGFLGSIGVLAHRHRIGELVPFSTLVLCRPIPADRRRAAGEIAVGEQAHVMAKLILGRRQQMAHRGRRATMRYTVMEWMAVVARTGGCQW